MNLQKGKRFLFQEDLPKLTGMPWHSDCRLGQEDHACGALPDMVKHGQSGWALSGPVLVNESKMQTALPNGQEAFKGPMKETDTRAAAATARQLYKKV